MLLIKIFIFDFHFLLRFPSCPRRLNNGITILLIFAIFDEHIIFFCMFCFPVCFFYLATLEYNLLLFLFLNSSMYLYLYIYILNRSGRSHYFLPFSSLFNHLESEKRFNWLFIYVWPNLAGYSTCVERLEIAKSFFFSSVNKKMCSKQASYANQMAS